MNVAQVLDIIGQVVGAATSAGQLIYDAWANDKALKPEEAWNVAVEALKQREAAYRRYEDDLRRRIVDAE